MQRLKTSVVARGGDTWLPRSAIFLNQLSFILRLLRNESLRAVRPIRRRRSRSARSTPKPNDRPEDSLTSCSATTPISRQAFSRFTSVPAVSYHAIE